MEILNVVDQVSCFGSGNHFNFLENEFIEEIEGGDSISLDFKYWVRHSEEKHLQDLLNDCCFEFCE